MEITEYNATQAGLEDITKRMKDVVYDVTTTSGMQAAKTDRRELISLRTTLEAKRKELKAPALERSRTIDSEAKRIEYKIRTLEEPIHRQIKVEEDKIKAEKEAQLNSSREKTRKIMERIEKLKLLPEIMAHHPAKELAATINSIENTAINEESFGEYLSIAEAAYLVTLNQLEIMLEEKTKTEAVEAEKELLRLAKIEEERIEREKEEQKLKEERDMLAGEREEFEKKLAEQKKIEDEKKAELKKIHDAEVEAKRIKDEAEAKRLAAEAVENEKLRKSAEKERKAAERKARVAEARCASSAEAFQKILDIIDAKTPTNENKLDEIQVIAEANS